MGSAPGLSGAGPGYGQLNPEAPCMATMQKNSNIGCQTPQEVMFYLSM